MTETDLVTDLVTGLETGPAAQIDIETMSDVFTKFHLRGPWPFDAVLHRFTEPDHGDPHDHPWGFRSIVLSGGYVEEVYRLDGRSERVERRPGDSFLIPATHIHRMVALPDGECWTLVLPFEAAHRDSRFYQFRADGAWSRAWHEPEFSRDENKMLKPRNAKLDQAMTLSRYAHDRVMVMEPGCERFVAIAASWGHE